MSTMIVTLMLAIMVIASLRAVRRPHPAVHIDEILSQETPRAGWGVLPWLLILVIIILGARLAFGG